MTEKKGPTLCNMDGTFVGYQLQLKVKKHAIYNRRSHVITPEKKLWDDRWSSFDLSDLEKIASEQTIQEIRARLYKGNYDGFPSHYMISFTYPRDFLVYLGSMLEFMYPKLEYRILPIHCRASYEQLEHLEPEYPSYEVKSDNTVSKDTK